MQQTPPARQRSTFRERGGAWVLAQTCLMLLVLALGPLTGGDSQFRGWASLGWLLFALGGAVGIAGGWVLGKNRTIFPRPQADSALVDHGIYRFVRHPLYVSVAALSFGWACLWHSLPTFIAAGGLALLLDRKARREETWLRGQFPGYEHYARRVRRFVPGIY